MPVAVGLHGIEEGISGLATIYDAASNAIFAAFTTPPTTARKALIDAAVVSLKGAGVWAKLDALYLYAAADSQAAKINWKAPGTYDSTELNAPTFTTDQGFLGASTKYLDTNFNASTATTPNYVRDSASVFAWSLTDITAGTFGILGYNTSGNVQIQPKTTGGTTCSWFINASAAAVTATVSNSLGLYCAVRTAAGAHAMYKDGTSIGTGSTASVAVTNEKINFLRRTTGYYLGTIAAGGIGSQLSAGENTSLYNAVHTYLQTVAGIA